LLISREENKQEEEEKIRFPSILISPSEADFLGPLLDNLFLVAGFFFAREEYLRQLIRKSVTSSSTLF